MIRNMSTAADGQTLEIHWESGETSRLSAAHLRANARDAWTKREILDTGAVHVAPGLSICGIDPVGHFGVNLQFSDGHDKAIYPFPYLRELSQSV